MDVQLDLPLTQPRIRRSFPRVGSKEKGGASEIVAKRVASRVELAHAAILAYLVGRDDTAPEITKAFGGDQQFWWPRFSELVKKNLIHRTGEMRKFTDERPGPFGVLRLGPKPPAQNADLAIREA